MIELVYVNRSLDLMSSTITADNTVIFSSQAASFNISFFDQWGNPIDPSVGIPIYHEGEALQNATRNVSSSVKCQHKVNLLL